MPARFLLTNDDGVEAPGLAALLQAVPEPAEWFVLAPDRHRSGCSHQVTTDRSMRLCQLDGRRYTLDGTPADCTRVGLVHIRPEVEWVLSGINEGGNLGSDVLMSGTVAAVREAALLGRRGIAISQYRRRREPVDWPRAWRWTRRAIEQLLVSNTPAGTFWNVNLPDPEGHDVEPEIVTCPLDPHPLPMAYHVQSELAEREPDSPGRYPTTPKGPGDNIVRYFGDYQGRQREAGHDVALCFAGSITATLLRLPASGASA